MAKRRKPPGTAATVDAEISRLVRGRHTLARRVLGQEPTAPALSGAALSGESRDDSTARKPGPSARVRLDERIALGQPLDTFTDGEVLDYVAFVLEGYAHLQGGIGGLNTARTLDIATRVRTISNAHKMNVRIKTNWAAGPREDT